MTGLGDEALPGHFHGERQETDRPSVDQRMVDRHAALSHHLFKVPIAQWVRRIPAHASQDSIDRKTYPLEVEHVGSPRLWAPQST